MHELIRLIGVLIGSVVTHTYNIKTEQSLPIPHINVHYCNLPQYGCTLGILVFDDFHKFILHRGLYHDILQFGLGNRFCNRFFL